MKLHLLVILVFSLRAIAAPLDDWIGNLASSQSSVQMKAAKSLSHLQDEVEKERAVKALMVAIRMLPLKRARARVRLSFFQALSRIGSGNPNVVRLMVQEVKSNRNSASQLSARSFLNQPMGEMKVAALREFLDSGSSKERMEILGYLTVDLTEPTEREMTALHSILKSEDFRSFDELEDLAFHWKLSLKPLAGEVKALMQKVLDTPSSHETSAFDNVLSNFYQKPLDSRVKNLGLLGRSLAFIDPGGDTTDFLSKVIKAKLRAEKIGPQVMGKLNSAISISKEGGVEIRVPKMEAEARLTKFLEVNRKVNWREKNFDYGYSSQSVKSDLLMVSPVDRQAFFEELASDAKNNRQAGLFLAYFLRHLNTSESTAILADAQLNPFCQKLIAELRKKKE